MAGGIQELVHETVKHTPHINDEPGGGSSPQVLRPRRSTQNDNWTHFLINWFSSLMRPRTYTHTHTHTHSTHKLPDTLWTTRSFWPPVRVFMFLFCFLLLLFFAALDSTLCAVVRRALPAESFDALIDCVQEADRERSAPPKVWTCALR